MSARDNQGPATGDNEAYRPLTAFPKCQENRSSQLIVDLQLAEIHRQQTAELFQRNCWISFEPVESSLHVLADVIGPKKIMWATDYPHPDGFFPGAPDMVRERLTGTSPTTQHGVLAGGAMAFYGLN